MKPPYLSWHPAPIIFFGVRIRLGTISGRFSIIYFRGLGLRIRVRVRVWVGLGLRLGLGHVMGMVSLGSELGLG